MDSVTVRFINVEEFIGSEGERCPGNVDNMGAETDL